MLTTPECIFARQPFLLCLVLLAVADSKLLYYVCFPLHDPHENEDRNANEKNYD